MMRKIVFFTLLSVMLVVMVTSIASGGQVVTDEVRAWAKEVVAQERALAPVKGSKTVAVLYFHNGTGDSALDPLQKGVALMLITDLAKVQGISVVERVRLQALMEELGLSVSGLTTPETSPRVGKLLRAAWVVGGEISGLSEKLSLLTRVLRVENERIVGEPKSKGALNEIFDMEKSILFEIIRLIKIKLTPVEVEEIRRPMTKNLDALMAFFMGIDASDRGAYEKAAAYYQEALKYDSNLKAAKVALEELRQLGLISSTKRSRKLLKSLKAQTSLTDTLTPEYPVKRVRAPGEVNLPQQEVITPNLPPDFGSTVEPSRPMSQPAGRPEIFHGGR